MENEKNESREYPCDIDLYFARRHATWRKRGSVVKQWLTIIAISAILARIGTTAGYPANTGSQSGPSMHQDNSSMLPFTVIPAEPFDASVDALFLKTAMGMTPLTTDTTAIVNLWRLN